MTTPTDPRIPLATRLMVDHRPTVVGRHDSPGGERYTCHCGESWSGDGAILRGHEHGVVALLAGLDAAMAVAS